MACEAAGAWLNRLLSQILRLSGGGNSSPKCYQDLLHCICRLMADFVAKVIDGLLNRSTSASLRPRAPRFATSKVLTAIRSAGASPTMGRLASPGPSVCSNYVKHYFKFGRRRILHYRVPPRRFAIGLSDNSLTHWTIEPAYSTTSSANSRSDVGTSRPSALAVFRLT
jgi:hypothetical protein